MAKSMIKRFDQLTQQELAELRQKAVGKKILIIVHPYLDDHNEELDEFLKGQRKNGFVTILMDCEWNIKQIFKRNEKALSQNYLVFAVHTRKNTDPTPSAGWQKIIKRLELIGAKRILVGGMVFAEIKAELLNRLVLRTKWIKDKSAKRGNSIDRAILRAMQLTGKEKSNFYGCAGVTTSKLLATGKFKVHTTNQFSKPSLKLMGK